MFNLTELLATALAGELIERRYIKRNRAKYRYHDAATEQDITVLIHFDDDFDTAQLYDDLHYGELVMYTKQNENCHLQCKVVQL